MQYLTREKGYYLPPGYNDNKIVLLVRDPYWLFAYWEVSGEKRENFIRQFGESAWNNSRPVIKLTNVTKGSVRYIEVNDFANNWYIEADYPNCFFSAEIGRIFSGDFFVSLAVSNPAFTPSNKTSANDSVLFANFKDLKTMKKVVVKTDLGKYDYKNTYEFSNTFGVSSEEFFGNSSEKLVR